MSQKLFDKGRNQLCILIENELIKMDDKYNNEYICPGTTLKFSEDKINELSLEDAPQCSLGGRKIALTSKSWNNKCGVEIDAYLLNSIINYENQNLVPGSESMVKMRIIDRVFNGILNVHTDGQLEMRNSNKQNDPKLLAKYMKFLFADYQYSIEYLLLKSDFNRASTAILKNAYIILFSKLGYIFLLDDYYSKIREQIDKPTEKIIPISFSMKPIQLPDGIYCMMPPCEKGFLVVYTLKRLQSYQVSVAIPTPSVSYEQMKSYTDSLNSGVSMKLKTLPIENDFWNDINYMKWVYDFVFK